MTIPARLQQIIEDFRFAEGREKLELLLQFSEEMQPLPDWLERDHDSMTQVHECMTPVFVFSQKEGDGLQWYFDVPKESPTVRGFAAVLGQGLAGANAPQVLALPNDFYYEMGLQSVLTGQRMNGIGAILRYMKNLAQKSQ
ncbi:MAG TPA: SufE family protein [Anaerolineales bacterium]|nr:SufE family protein [Anaerolineales bacterium]